MIRFDCFLKALPSFLRPNHHTTHPRHLNLTHHHLQVHTSQHTLCRQWHTVSAYVSQFVPQPLPQLAAL